MALDIPSLLHPMSPDAPCGENLEYESEYIALELASQGKPEQEYGETKIPAEPPDWKEVIRLGQGLLTRTMDLRIACHVARAVLEVQQIEDFADALRLIHGYVSQYWEGVHPQLDPEDDNDPTWRVNTLSSLNDFHTTVQSLRNAILVDAGVLGRVSLRDIEIARGDRSAADHEHPTMTDIEAAFQQADGAALRHRTQSVHDAIEQLGAIEATVTECVGADHAGNFETLRGTLRNIEGVLQGQLNRLGLNVPVTAGSEEAVVAGEEADEPQALDVTVAATPPPQVESTEIRSREDVIKTLDRLCEYYDKYEPSSPLPLLLRRAQRLASMSFLDIIKDLTPEGLTQAKSISGIEEREES